MEAEIKQITDRAESAVVALVSQKVTSFIVQRVTWFAFPPLSWALSFVLGRIIPDLYKEGALDLKYWSIDRDVEKENALAKEAKENLEKAIIEGDKDVIAKAKEDFKNKYSDLIHMHKP